MSQLLPIGIFRWEEDPNNIDYEDYLEDSDRGLVLEVDLEYPERLHREHNGYPLAPESMEIKKDMFGLVLSYVLMYLILAFAYLYAMYLTPSRIPFSKN